MSYSQPLVANRKRRYTSVMHNRPKPQRKLQTTPSKQDETAIFAAELGGHAVSIDLHGLDAHEALLQLDAFLNRCFVHDGAVVRIIHGRGSGKLRTAIRSALKTHPLVSMYRDANSSTEDGGVTYVALAKKK